MAKKFFYMCGGLLMLALAYHFGATNAQSQTSGFALAGVSTGNQSYIVAGATNGDVFVHGVGGWTYIGNPLVAPTNSTEQSWGQVKARYR